MLKNLKIGTKMLLMLLLPIIGLLYFSFKDVVACYDTVQDTAASQLQASLAVASSSLIHELQKERGLTAGFIGSKGEKFKSELAKQREETTARLKKLNEFVAANSSSLEPLKAALSQSGGKLEKLSDIRSSADSFKLEGKESFAFYTQAIAANMDIISTIATSSNEAGVVTDAVSYYSFLNCKEQAGRERATINAVLSSGRFEEETYRRFISIIAAQNEYFSIFSKNIHSKDLAFAREKLNTPAATKVEEMRTIVLAKSASGDFGIAPEQWFSTITEKINSMKEVEDYLSKHLVEGTEQLSSTAKRRLSISVTITLVLIVVAMAFGYILATSIRRPLKSMVTMLKDIAEGEGDLTRRLDASRRDELGEVCHWFNRFVDNVHNIIKQVTSTSAQVTDSANHLHSTAEQIATGAEEVAAQSSTVATAGEEMSATSRDIAQNCQMAAEGAQRASQSAQNGAVVVDKTVTIMGEIATKVQETAKTVEKLGARSDQIGAIIGTIEDIADQTNLLALNAAIEAARAGEQGRGFAVVADEVRALAERTTKATREIGEMIKAIQTETKGAVAAMEHGVSQVETGTGEAAKSGDALRDILEQVNTVAMQVNQIATAAEEQTATTSEISSNMMQITEVVLQTSQGAQESATAAARLNGNAEELQRLVHQFKV